MNNGYIQEANKYIMNTYNRYSIVFRKGRQCRLYSEDGKEYIDFIGGIAVNVLGHCHPKVVVALQKQAQRLLHVSNLYYIEPQIKLAKILVEHSFADKVFFCNSGAEANEAAIKLARKYAKVHYAEECYEIITAYNSFHGRTIATITATGQEKFKKGFEPLLAGFRHVRFNDYEELKNAITNKTAAVMLEPIQGEGGVVVASEDYLKKVRELCDKTNTLLIFDEVQTGIGRTGTLFAYEQFGIEPDIMTLAKGLGGGVPIGAMLAKEKVAEVFTPGSHASTFGGNPLVCAAAVATVETLLEDGVILKHCQRMGKYFMEKLLYLKDLFPFIISDVRGKGLMLGMELKSECSPVVEACMDRGVLLNCTANNTLRFTPPLIISKSEIDILIDVLNDIFRRI